MMAYYEKINKPFIIQVYDLSKYFDKESLRDAMNSLYETGVKGKLYRLWFMMNCGNQVKVLTSAGMTGILATGKMSDKGQWAAPS